MQVNGNYSNLGQLNVQIRYWIILKLGKQQRLELTIFLESGKTKASLLKYSQPLCNCLIACWRT
jgi:hypothetical protein